MKKIFSLIVVPLGLLVATVIHSPQAIAQQPQDNHPLTLVIEQHVESAPVYAIELSRIQSILFQERAIELKAVEGTTIPVPTRYNLIDIKRLFFSRRHAPVATEGVLSGTRLYAHQQGEQLFIEGAVDSRNYVLGVFDMAGQLILARKSFKPEQAIDISTWPTGASFLIRLNEEAILFVKQ